jgi:hypothetical protein
MELVQLGSERYKEFLYKDKKGRVEKVPTEDLIVGNLYENKSGVQGIYLGQVNTIRFIYPQGNVAATRFLNYKLTNKMMWLEIGPRSTVDIIELYKELQHNHKAEVSWDSKLFFKSGSGHLTIKESHSYRLDLGKVCEPDLKSITNRAREMTYHQTKGRCDRFTFCELFGEMLTVYPKGTTPRVSPRVMQLLRRINFVIIPPDITLEELPEFLTHPDSLVREEAKRRYRKLCDEKTKS